MCIEFIFSIDESSQYTSCSAWFHPPAVLSVIYHLLCHLKNGGPIVSTDWKRYRDDTINIEEDVEDQKLSSFTEYLNSNMLENKI